ncbi:MAG: methylthioribulose 1-phosphate dehydratase [Rhodanobacter sp.]|jgi:methylthioribulose-1-phosphate dehydratase|nr:methylthioribulose 1-phosphate dehydratase [Rhodanobacter sp.]
MTQPLPATLPDDLFAARADAIAAAAGELCALGWTPATSSNFSMRIDADHAAITISGRHKGQLGRDDIMLIDMQGNAVGTDARPSAETVLHTHIYRRWPEMQVVLHTHSRTQSVASRLYAADGLIRLQGWELQKAITGFTTHDSVLEIPVFPNTQHMPDLIARVDAWLDADKPLHAYLIDGHGIYTWGRDMAETRRHLEALEFLLACELDLKRLSS